MASILSPDLFFLAFLVCQEFLDFLSVFPPSQGCGGGRMGRKILVFFGGLRRLLNHPSKRIVHQTVSIYLFFVHSIFFECTRFLSSACFDSISPLEVPASVCLPG